MIHLVVGKDYDFTKKEIDKFISSFSKDKKIQIQKHTPQTITINELVYSSQGSSLFGDIYLFVIDGLIEQEKEEILKHLEALHKSDHLFLFKEDSINKEIEKSFIEFDVKIVLFKNAEKSYDNPFAITDALISRDKKKIWQLYRNEIDGGESAEAIIGRFAWAMKTLLLIIKNPNQNAGDLGISPFVYSKTKNGSKKWNTEDVVDFYTNLLFNSKKGEEMEHHLEKLILEKV